MKRVFAIMILAALLLSGCANSVGTANDIASNDAVATGETAATEKPTQFDPMEGLEVKPTQAPTEPPTLDDLAKAKYNKILKKKKANHAQLKNVTALNQMNGMQAGCEALALTAALSHFGYDLDINDIVDNYLVYSDNFVTGYCGDPHYFYDGSGIYPPGMVKTTWNFIKKNDAELYPFDTTGLSMDKLYKFVKAGCPILIWTTYDRSSPYIEQTTEYNGISYPWYASEHCVCLVGYDLESSQVLVADSWGGYVDWEDAGRFESIYDEVGQFSMVLMDVSDLK